VFDVTTKGYVSTSRLLVRRALLTIVIVAGVAVGAGLFAGSFRQGSSRTRTRDLWRQRPAPARSSLERTSTVLKKVETFSRRPKGGVIPDHRRLRAVTNTYQPNYGSMFARLKPWEERGEEELKVKGIMAGLQRQFAGIPEAVIFPFNIPTLAGFGAASGFNFLIQDRSAP